MYRSKEIRYQLTNLQFKKKLPTVLIIYLPARPFEAHDFCIRFYLSITLHTIYIHTTFCLHTGNRYMKYSDQIQISL